MKGLGVVPGRPNKYGAIRYVKVRVFLKGYFSTEKSVMLRGRSYEQMDLKWPETGSELLAQV